MYHNIYKYLILHNMFYIITMLYYYYVIHIQKDTFFDHILCTGLLIE